MKYLNSVRLLTIAGVLIIVGGCGSEKSEPLVPRKLNYGGDSLTTTTQNPSSETEAVSLAIAKKAVFKFSFPNTKKDECIVNGDKAEWKIKSTSFKGLTLENTSLCEITVNTSEAFSAEVELEGSFTQLNKKYTYQVKMYPSVCDASLEEMTPNADGSIRCIEARSDLLCTDDLVLSSMSYSTAGAKLLFGSKGPGTRPLYHNCQNSPYKNIEWNLKVFDASQKFVTKGHIQIALNYSNGRLHSSLDYDFCIDPKQPSKVVFSLSPVAGGALTSSYPRYNNSPSFSYGDIPYLFDNKTYRAAIFLMHPWSDNANYRVTLSNAGQRYGEITCGAGFTTDGALER